MKSKTHLKTKPHAALPVTTSVQKMSAPLQQAKAIAAALEQLADQLRPEVIRAARLDDDGRRDLDRIEYALGTIGKALILTDYSIDEEKDIDKLKAFRESQKGMG